MLTYKNSPEHHSSWCAFSCLMMFNGVKIKAGRNSSTNDFILISEMPHSKYCARIIVPKAAKESAQKLLKFS